MHRHPSEPLEAVLLPDPPKASSAAWRNWALALGAFCLFVVCSGVGFWGLGKIANLGFAGSSSKDSLIYSWETPEEQLANVAAGMNATSQGCTAVELRELTRFFTRVMDTLAQEDHAEFRALVDQNAFAHRASLHPVAAAYEDFDQGAIESQLEYDLEGPRDWTRFSIVHVARGTAANEALVYLVFTGEGQNATPFRWWLRRSGRNWTICDWEIIDLGHSEAARWARYQSIGDDPASAQYWQASAAIERATDESQAGRLGAAAAQLRDAEKKRLPAEVADMTHVSIAIDWLHCQRPDLALAATERVSEPETDIGAVHIRALALADLERQDELLAALAKYRAMAGCHPELLRLEAEALESLGKRKEAAECWWEFLRLLPDDRDALYDFCRLADDSRRAEIKTILEKSRKPVDRAVEAALEAIQRDEAAAAEALVSYVRSAEPNSAALEHLTALQLDYDMQYPEAAEHYLSAHKLESHPEKKREHFRRYLASMAAAHRAAEAYQAAEDPDAAFDYLTAGHEYEEAYVAGAELAELIALHRQRKPDDRRLLYLSGSSLLNQGDFAAAAAEFLKAEAGADAELSGLIRSGRLKAIYSKGSIKQAYEAYTEGRPDVFRELAWLASSRNDNKGLAELISLHVRVSPADPWLSYFTAVREEAQSNYTAALTALLPAQNADDAHLQSLCAQLKTELYIKSDNVSQAYLSSGAPPESFQLIANRLAEMGNWDGLLEVAQLHLAAAPNDAAAIYYATKARWHKGQYELLIQDLTPWPKERLKNLDQAWATEMADLHVRAWLRVRPGEDARKIAEFVRDELSSDLPLVTAELALGNHQRVNELLNQPWVAREFFQRQLQLDQECSQVLTAPEYADLRRNYALERPNDYGRPSATILLLLKKPLDKARWSEEFERAVSSEAAGRARELSETVEGKERTSRIVELPGGTLIMTARSAPYCDSKIIHATLLAPDSPLRKSLDEHAAWIAIDLLLADQQEPARELKQTAQRLAAGLCDENARLVYVTRPGRSAPHLVLADVAVRARMENGVFLDEPDSAERGSIYLYESTGEEPEVDPSDWPKRRKELRELADRARVENDAGHATVRVRFVRGHAEEDGWLKIVRSKRGYYRSEDFIGEATADSRLWPHLRTGERVRIGFHEPREVRSVAAP